MLAGQVSSTRKKQEFVIQSNSSISQIISLYYNGSITVDWGDGTTDYLYSNNNTSARTFSHTYSTIYSGQIKIRGSVNVIRRISLGSYGDTGTTQSQIQKLSSLDYFNSNSSTRHNWNLDISNLPSRLTYLSNTGNNQSYGTINDLPSGLEHLTITGSNSVTGNISNFFGTTASPKLPNIRHISIEGKNTLSGDLIDIYNSFGPGSLHSDLIIFSIKGQNTITGDLQYVFIPNLRNFVVWGNNTIYGELISMLAAGSGMYIERFEALGNNTISGDINGLSAYNTLRYINIRGGNTTDGDISLLPSSLNYYYNSGSNSVTGDIQYLSATLSTFYSLGNNTIYGDLSSLKSVITTFYVSGFNTVSGDISHLSNLIKLNSFTVTGRSSIYGDIQYLPPSLDTFSTNSSGIIYGTISNLDTPILELISITATNSISGNISDIPDTVTYLDIRKCSNKLTYSGKTWPENMRRVYLQPLINKGLTTTEVDLLLNDLANIETWYPLITTSYRYIWIAGQNEPRSSASDNAVSILISKNVAVTTNVL